MFRIFPHRALVEPKVRATEVSTTGEQAFATLRIDGLLCSACAANVRARLERVPGVRSAEVALERGEARVSYDPLRATPEALVSAVEGAVILRPLRRLLARIAHRRSASSDPDAPAARA